MVERKTRTQEQGNEQGRAGENQMHPYHAGVEDDLRVCAQPGQWSQGNQSHYLLWYDEDLPVGPESRPLQALGQDLFEGAHLEVAHTQGPNQRGGCELFVVALTGNKR